MGAALPKRDKIQIHNKHKSIKNGCVKQLITTKVHNRASNRFVTQRGPLVLAYGSVELLISSLASGNHVESSLFLVDSEVA